jgi:uncharacterized membrane protein
MGSVVNLNGTAHYVHWHFFLMSVPNVVVIVLMLIVFTVALFLRAPGAKKPGGHK